jgi:hypothetical protein
LDAQTSQKVAARAEDRQFQMVMLDTSVRRNRFCRVLRFALAASEAIRTYNLLILFCHLMQKGRKGFTALVA